MVVSRKHCCDRLWRLEHSASIVPNMWDGHKVMIQRRTSIDVLDVLRERVSAGHAAVALQGRLA
jgi:hypothetical protein